MQYLVVKCDDSYDSIVDRQPICITNNITTYGRQYEIYKISPDGKLKLIKDYCVTLESGIALYKWHADKNLDRYCLPDEIICKWKNKTSKSFTKSLIKRIKGQVGFKSQVEEIYDNFTRWGVYSEEINGEWVVLGEYNDNIYDLNL